MTETRPAFPARAPDTCPETNQPGDTRDMCDAEAINSFPSVSTLPGPGPLCAQALAGLPLSDRARRGDVIGLGLEILRDRPGSGFRLSGTIGYWVQENDGLRLQPLRQVPTLKLGRASFALASLLDDRDYIKHLLSRAGRLKPCAIRDNEPVLVVVLRNAALLLPQGVSAAQDSDAAIAGCFLPEGIPEPEEMEARRGVAGFLAALARKDEMTLEG